MAPLEASVWLQIISLCLKLKFNPTGLIPQILIGNHSSGGTRVVKEKWPSYVLSPPAFLHLGLTKTKKNIKKWIWDTVLQLNRAWAPYYLVSRNPSKLPLQRRTCETTESFHPGLFQYCAFRHSLTINIFALANLVWVKLWNMFFCIAQFIKICVVYLFPQF